ncbi:MAG TPA: ATP-binding protein [Gammaproteobacteria bacterium]|nr:ATP-binding protein [Gammaproteobacteria bacterium]
MKRTAISAILAVAALAMLAALVLRSRSLPLTVHIAENTIGTELDRATEDFATLVATLQASWTATQAPGEGARALSERLAASPERIRRLVAEIPGGGSQRARLKNSYDGFAGTMKEASSLAREIVDDENAYIADLDFVRNEGPKIIQQMREVKLDAAAANTFQLVIGTLDFAKPDATVRELELRRLITTLARDNRVDANMPGEVAQFAQAAQRILDTKPSIQSKLTQLAGTPVSTMASALAFASGDVYRSAVASGEQARLMLSIYAVALLVAMSFVAFRLQASYREINRANAQLAGLNESLEQRVEERTQELAGALTNLKESQVQLVQAEKMSSLGQLVAGISHEINTPLLYLSNNAVLIQERVHLMRKFVDRCARAFELNPADCKDRSEFQAQFVNALKGVKHMLQHEDLAATMQEAMDLARDSIEGLGDLTEMAQSLKDFSRLDRAPVGSFDVNGGLDKTLLIARNIIKHKADVRKFYGDLPEIECSPSQINQVFLNIVTNAAQAIEGHGEIVITTKLRDADHVAISIADNGCGIPAEIMDKIRDPFFTTKEVGTGTGLGLSIVDEIIRGHKGELLINSEVGKGSVFTVVLPIKQVKEGLDPLEGLEAQDESVTAPALEDDAAEALAEAV